MTNDLVKRLDEEQPVTQDMESTSIGDLMHQAARHIEALEAQLAEADELAKRLEGLISKIVAWEGEKPTHVIVPLEPTEAMVEAGYDEIGGFEPVDDRIAPAYRAMIKAAQEGE